MFKWIMTLVLLPAVCCLAFRSDHPESSGVTKEDNPKATKKDDPEVTKRDNPKVKKKDNVVVVIETSMGAIEVELWADRAPITVANFLSYADKGFYDGTIFHRIIKDFMAQGGGFTPDMKQKPTDRQIKNEAGNGAKNERGTLAMARTNVVDSATAQFFINLADNDFLNHRDETPAGFGYAVFGRVIEGMDVVDAMAKITTGQRGPYKDVPVEPVTIKTIRRK